MVTTLRMIFPNAVQGTEDGTTKRHLGTKNGWKGKEGSGILEPGKAEITQWKLHRSYDLKPPSSKLSHFHGANYAPQPGLTKPRRLWQELGLLQEGGCLSPRQQGEPGDQWQQACAAAPGPLQWPSWYCLPLPLKSPTQWFFGLTNPHLCRTREFWKTQSYLSQRDTIQIHHA